MRSQQRRLRYLEALGAVRRRGAANGAPCGLLLLVLIASGCGATITDSPGGARSTTVPTTQPGRGSSHGDQAAVPVVLRDPAPGTLDVSLAVTFDQQIGDSQPMIEVGLAFLSGDHPVQFAGDERVTCDGAALSLKNRAAIFQVLRAPARQVAGTTVRCTYAASGAVASVVLQIPLAPAITSPTVGAKVARGVRTLVTYRYDAATCCTMLGIVALAAPSSPSAKAVAKTNTPGPLHATVDTSGFAPGPGSLVLTAFFTPPIVGTGAPFQSVSASGSATAWVAVTWI